MKNETTEVKNQTVDKTNEHVVGLESVATHLQNAIAHHTDAVQATRSNESDSQSLLSISACLIALTQHLTAANQTQTTSPITFPVSQDDLQPASPFEGEEASTTDEPSDNPNPFADNEPSTTDRGFEYEAEQATDEWLRNHSESCSIPDCRKAAKAELARRESKPEPDHEFDRMTYATRNLTWSETTDTTPFDQETSDHIRQNIADREAGRAPFNQPPFENPEEKVSLEELGFKPLPETTRVEQIDFSKPENTPFKTYTFTRDELVEFIKDVDQSITEECVDAFLKERSS